MSEKLVVGFRFDYGDCTYEISEIFEGKVYCDLVTCGETVFTITEAEDIIEQADTDE